MLNLFSELRLKEITFKNRIAIPPMCQYTANDGYINDWHKVHYASLARGGAGLIIVEATGVSPEGRITPACLGLWRDEQIIGHQDIVKSIEEYGVVPGIQIAHAGRKASANLPWEGDDHILNNDIGWKTLSPSPIAFSDTLSKIPQEMSLLDIEKVKNDYVAAAKRALEAGYKYLELHFAHGYLAQSFLSIHANIRTDDYGGPFENRSRFIKETFAAVREVWPENLPLTARIGVIEYDGRDEEMMNESVTLTKQLKEAGLDLLNVSLGFSTPNAKIPWGKGFMSDVSKRIKDEVQIPVASAWGFGYPEIAQKAIADEILDLVMVGKAHLANPHWSYFAAATLAKENPSWVLPPSYAHWLERYEI